MGRFLALHLNIALSFFKLFVSDAPKNFVILSKVEESRGSETIIFILRPCHNYQLFIINY